MPAQNIGNFLEDRRKLLPEITPLRSLRIFLAIRSDDNSFDER